MQNFIVLGIIPGTDYQTTFTFWLVVAAIVLGLLSLPRIVYMLGRMRRSYAMWQIAHTINELDLVTI
jgi:hypothetical protein